MNENAYLKTSLSPYTLNGDAMRLIVSLRENFSSELEQKIIILINAAAMHPSMSHYQLSLTHKALGDCYYEYGYFGSALEQYRRALDYNKNLALKRRMSKMLSLTPEDRKVSQSPDMVYDVLQYPEYKKLVEDDAEDRKRLIDELWAGHKEERQILDRIGVETAQNAVLDDSIIDPVHDAEIERRLNVLGEPYKSWFYEMREKRRLTQRPDDTISFKEHDLMELCIHRNESATCTENFCQAAGENPPPRRKGPPVIGSASRGGGQSQRSVIVVGDRDTVGSQNSLQHLSALQVKV